MPGNLVPPGGEGGKATPIDDAYWGRGGLSWTRESDDGQYSWTAIWDTPQGDYELVFSISESGEWLVERIDLNDDPEGDYPLDVADGKADDYQAAVGQIDEWMKRVAFPEHDKSVYDEVMMPQSTEARIAAEFDGEAPADRAFAKEWGEHGPAWYMEKQDWMKFIVMPDVEYPGSFRVVDAEFDDIMAFDLTLDEAIQEAEGYNEEAFDAADRDLEGVDEKLDAFAAKVREMFSAG